MHYLQTKANKIFKIIIENELTRGLLRYVIKNQTLPFWIRQLAVNILVTAFSLKSSLTYLRRRCYFTNRARSLNSFLKLNRMRMKTLVGRAQLTGIMKNTW